MTDNEIIKALEEELGTALIINHRFEESNDTENPDDHRFIALLSRTIKLINRQKAEIERLKSLNQATLDMTHDLRAKLEALTDQEAREHQYCKNVCEPRYKAEIEKLEKQKNTFAKRFYKEGIKDFAERLKAKNKKPECPWEDYSICESDIDETYEELVGVEK